MVAELAPFADVFRLNTTLFRNTLVGLDDTRASVRPNDRTNSVAFIAGHLVESRAWMARYLGLDVKAPFGGVLEHATSIDQIAKLPALTEIGGSWDQISGLVLERFPLLAGSDLAALTTQRFPGVPGTVLGGIAFLIQHESYHIGQLAWLRKYLGFPAMKYR